MNQELDSYRTIGERQETELNIKRSRFIAYAIPIRDASEALQEIATLRKIHYSATHVCWAYALDPYFKDFRINDDGEPSGTAGRPILGRLISLNITATLIVVVRYFGGVKLGTGGLIEAYKSTAQTVLEQCSLKAVITTQHLKIEFPPHLVGEVMRIIKVHNANITHQYYTTGYRLEVALRASQMPNLQQALGELYEVKFISPKDVEL